MLCYCTLAFLIVAIIVSPIVHGYNFPWGKDPVARERDDTWQSDVSAILRNQGQLDMYSRRPDCFRRVAGEIKVHCVHIEMDEEERVSAAISMTLCELATGSHSPPLECSQIAEADGASQRRCVEALSRSAQYWSSYSGYLREVPQLCHAFRRWHDIDTARDTYRNATLEAISVLRAVKEFQDEQRSVHADSAATLEQMRGMLFGAENSQANLRDSLASVQVELLASANMAIDELKGWFLASHASHQQDLRRALEQMNVEFDSAIAIHAQSLSAVGQSLDISLQSRLTETFSGLAPQLQAVDRYASSAVQHLGILDTRLSVMEEAVLKLVDGAINAAAHLEAHSAQAEHAQRVQQDTVASAMRLGTTLTDLTSWTAVEMERLNDTATTVYHDIVSAGRFHGAALHASRWNEWYTSAIIWSVQLVLGAKRPEMDYILTLPVVRYGGVFLQFAWYLLRTSLSSMMSITFLLFSLRKKITSVAVPSLRSQDDLKCANVPVETFDLLPHRLSAYRPARPFIASVDNRLRRPRFSRIPDRLCNPSHDI